MSKGHRIATTSSRHSGKAVQAARALVHGQSPGPNLHGKGVVPRGEAYHGSLVLPASGGLLVSGTTTPETTPATGGEKTTPTP
jgi:hypothetical protein